MKKLLIVGCFSLSTFATANPLGADLNDQKATIAVQGDHVCWDEGCPKEPWIETVSVSVTDIDGIAAVRVIQRDNWIAKEMDATKKVARTIEFPYQGEKTTVEAVGVPMERGDDWEMVIEVEDLNGVVASKSFVVQANVD